ncbi:hypothetical protein AAE478_003953 [Parahypoxylon ruwenzoriense]
MKLFRNLYLIPIVVHTVVIFANLLGGFNGIDPGGANHRPFGSSNYGPNYGSNNNWHANANDYPFPAGKDSNHNGFGDTSGYGSINNHGKGQGNAYGSQGIDSIVNAIHSADQQVHTVNLAIRNIRVGGNIDHLDSTLRSLSSTITVTSNAIDAVGSFHSGDIQTLNGAIEPFGLSIGTLITQLVSRRDTIAKLCGCRIIEGAVNQIQGATRLMFDGIKSRWNQGGSPHGVHGFGTFHSLDSGISNSLGHGFAAFGFGQCIDFVYTPLQISSTDTTPETSIWVYSTVTDFSTVVITSTVTATVTSFSYFTYSVYSSNFATSTPSFGRGGEWGYSGYPNKHGSVITSIGTTPYSSSLTNTDTSRTLAAEKLTASIITSTRFSVTSSYPSTFSSFTFSLPSSTSSRFLYFDFHFYSDGFLFIYINVLQLFISINLHIHHN